MAEFNNQKQSQINQDLKEKMYEAIVEYKEDVNNQEYISVAQALYQVNMAADNLNFRLNYEVDQFDLSLTKKENYMVPAATNREDVNKKKAEMLIKLQTLTSEITCRIFEDYKKIVGKKIST